MAEEGIQVLEVELGSAAYCLEIDYIAKVIDNAELTALPHALEHIGGIIDLRGRTTSIVHPRRVLELDEVEEGARIDPCSADEPPNDDKAVRGIVQRNGNFVTWLDPDPING